jgi:hypothetical protein
MVPVELRDDVVDCLMACEHVSGFNMTSMAGYSKEHSQYDLREQVEGYRQFFKFEVMHPAARQVALMDSLRPACAAAHIRYWVVPVREQGHL